MMDTAVQQAFDDLFRAQRELARAENMKRRADVEQQIAEEALDQAQQVVARADGRIKQLATKAAGVEAPVIDEDAESVPDRAADGFTPVRPRSF